MRSKVADVEEALLQGEANNAKKAVSVRQLAGKRPAVWHNTPVRPSFNAAIDTGTIQVLEFSVLYMVWRFRLLSASLCFMHEFSIGLTIVPLQRACVRTCYMQSVWIL